MMVQSTVSRKGRGRFAVRLVRRIASSAGRAPFPGLVFTRQTLGRRHLRDLEAHGRSESADAAESAPQTSSC
jgi:hypothetical protein